VMDTAFLFRKVDCFDTVECAVVSRVYSPVVQLVEHRTVNPYVAGSSPAGGANIRSGGRMVMQRIANP
jgi:hypothetical protein